ADRQQSAIGQRQRRQHRGIGWRREDQAAEALEVVAGIELPEAVLVDVEHEGALRLAERQVGSIDAERRLELEIADPEHKSGKVQQLPEARRLRGGRIRQGWEGQFFGEAQRAEPIAERRRGGAGIEERAVDGKNRDVHVNFADESPGSTDRGSDAVWKRGRLVAPASVDRHIESQRDIAAESLEAIFAQGAAPGVTPPLDVEQIVAG